MGSDARIYPETMNAAAPSPAPRRSRRSTHRWMAARLLPVALAFFNLPGPDAARAQTSPAETPSPAAPSPTPASTEDLPHQVLAELNRARTRPGEYADSLAARRPAYQGKMLNLPGQTPLRTQEGVAALDEAVQALRALPAPLPALVFDAALAAAARELADDQARTGLTGHQGSDGGTLPVRLERRGTVQGAAGENLAYGPAAAEEIVGSLLLDDGLPSRGHRLNILHPDFRLVGVALAEHPKWKHVCVMDFAQAFEPKP